MVTYNCTNLFNTNKGDKFDEDNTYEKAKRKRNYDNSISYYNSSTNNTCSSYNKYITWRK